LFLCFFSAQETFAQSKKKRKADKERPKWKLKVLTPKNQKPYKKLLIQLQLRKED
jgi:hypothetical protein